MDDASDFLNRYRPRLLEYLDGVAPRSQSDPDALVFVDEVLDAWSRWADGRELQEPEREERTFWFALYQLEGLVEEPPGDNPLPYETLMMRNLAQVRELLRAGAPLPARFHATRPGEGMYAGDDDDEMLL